MDGRSTNDYLTEFCHMFEEAECSGEKGNLFYLSNVDLIRHIHCPKDFVIDLELVHHLLYENEADDINNIPRANGRLSCVLQKLRMRAKWEKIPIFIAAVQAYNKPIADELQARWECMSKLIG